MTVAGFGEKFEVQKNTILMWSGPLSEIPSGWVICDGNNSTPNLLDKFVRSVPNSSTDPGSTGGQSDYTISTSQMRSHSHNGNTSSEGGHSHTADYASAERDDGPGGDKPDNSSFGSALTSTGSHNHSISVDSAGSGSSVSNNPAFYEIIFIMKV